MKLSKQFDKTNSKPVRSDKYQNIFHEIYVSDEYLSTFTDPQESYDKECKIEDLKTKLYEEVLKLIDSDKFTEHQKTIFKMSMNGMTQQEIANKLNIHQSSVNKCLYGNSVKTDPRARQVRHRHHTDSNSKIHRNSKGDIMYGGILKKLKNLVAMNELIQQILKEIEETI